MATARTGLYQLRKTSQYKKKVYTLIVRPHKLKREQAYENGEPIPSGLLDHGHSYSAPVPMLTDAVRADSLFTTHNKNPEA